MRRVLAGVLAGVLVGSAAIAQTPADVDHAKDLYASARKALDEGRHADAIRDFGAAYEITKDAVMFYWIGNANERAGKCDVALTYYGRYLKEGQPSEQFLETVRQRVTACGGDPDASGSAGSAPAPTPTPTPAP